MGFNTLDSILTVKVANTNATKFKPDKALLKSAKSATWEYNKKHPSSITIKKWKKNDVIILCLAVYFYLP